MMHIEQLKTVAFVAAVLGGIGGAVGHPVWGSLVAVAVSGLTLSAADLADWVRGRHKRP